MFKRTFLFVITNLSVTIIFGLVLFLTGIKSNSIGGLIILSMLVGFSGAIASLFLSKWIALKSVQGHIIKKPRNQLEAWIFNVVKNQSKKVDIIPPDILVYYTEEVNAFATGYSKNTSLLALSTGLLQSMNKDNLEAIIAHEISHIVNGDMITLTLMQGIVNTFVFFLSTIITQAITNIISNNKDSIFVKYMGFFINLFLLTLLQSIFGILATVIVMAYSRYREFRADADSTKLVGSKKMIDALIKFKNISEPTVSNNIKTYCIRGKSKSFLNLFSSHPPTEERIIALNKKTYI